MKKLVVFDLDGTLLDSSGNITKESIDAIQKLKKHDYEVTIATGRAEILIREYMKKLSIKMPVITCNGSVVANGLTQQTLISKHFTKERVEEIIEYCNMHGHVIMAYTDHIIFTKMNDRVAYFTKRNELLPLDERVHFDFNLEKAYAEAVHKLLIIERNPQKYTQLKDKLHRYEDLEVVQSNEGLLDIMPKGCSKKTGIEVLETHLGIDRRDIVAFGDQYNDLEMLQYAGVAIGMGNAVSEVKEAVHHVTLDHDSGGIAYAIEHILLKRE